MTLYDAVLSGNFAAFKKALAEASDLNVLGPEQRTPLIEAAAAGQVEMVKALLAAGAEPSWKDEAMETALLKGAANGHAQVVTLLFASATDDERDMARSFLKAFNASSGKEYVYDPKEAARLLSSRVEPGPETGPTAMEQKTAEVAARAASFFGYEDPLKRVERADRAKKKR